jgi:hypothetical protein
MSTLVPGTTPAAFTPAPPAPPPAAPHQILANMTTGWVAARAVQVVADLAVADALGDAPQAAAALAAATGSHPQALERVLRLLASHGVFAVDDAGMVSHTAASRVLRADHPQSFKAGARLWGLPFIRGSSEHFAHALRTGRPAVEAFAPAGLFPYLAEHPDEARAFGEAMASKAHAQVAGVLAAYDFAGFGLIGDIGGGHGHLVSAILDRAPGARGVLFDQPHVIAEVAGLTSDRLALVGGDFFRDALPVCDAYVLMEIIHDWGDAEAAAILRAVRAAAPPHAVLLLVEDIVPDGPGPSWARTLDVVMLAVTGGLQRTAREYDALLAGCGFRMERVLDTPTGISIVEARPV